MKSLFQIAFSVSLVLLSCVAVFSCSCADPSVREKFRTANAVFVGSLVEMTPIEPTSDFPLAVNMVRFKVEKAWKGARTSEITALADFDSPGWCGDLNLTVGERYLIYADRRIGRLVVHTDCGPNRNLKHAAKEMRRLNNFWFRCFARLYPYPA